MGVIADANIYLLRRQGGGEKRESEKKKERPKILEPNALWSCEGIRVLSGFKIHPEEAGAVRGRLQGR